MTTSGPDDAAEVRTVPVGSSVDGVDVRLLLALSEDPRGTTIALAEKVGVSRNTAQAHLNKLDRSGAVLPFERRIDPGALGYPLRAFVMTNVKQRRLGAVAAALADIDEVTEVVGLSGGADLLIQVVARDGDDLYRIAGRILDIKGVKRTSTSLVMRELLDYRVNQLLRVDNRR
ncbi:Lrp/AsnC family transcriptional regulator [Williamsia maris]|uniref:Lrp/AsnC family transcriptional regulator n=1 Tax=Williamsia maris TaxID=72806 RepID=UPI0020A24252|nr:Lrp/AsnC family transcriptional regulator [Williamsia maris]